MISQIKRRFEELSEYLNNDTAGQKRLKALKDDVNVLRKAMAAAVEDTKRAEEIKHTTRVRADSAELQVEKAEQVATQLKDQVASLRREVTELERKLRPDLVTAESIPGDKSHRLREAILEALLHLRKTNPICPTYIATVSATGFSPGYNGKVRTVAEVYDLDEFENDWSPASLCRLGTAMALIVQMTGEVTFIGDASLARKDYLGGHVSKVLEIGLHSWFSANLDQMVAEDQQEVVAHRELMRGPSTKKQFNRAKKEEKGTT